MDVLAHPHAPEDHAGLSGRKVPRHSADGGRINPAQLFHLFGGELLQVLFLSIPVFSEGFDVLLIVELFLHDHMHDRVQQRHIRAGFERQHMLSKPLQPLGARIHDDELATALGKLLEIGRRNRMVLQRVGANNDGDIRILDLIEGRSHSAGAYVFNQRRNRGCVAKPRAVIDVVVTKSLANELLEKISFLVRTLGRTEPCNLTPTAFQPFGRKIKRLIPSRLAEVLLPIVWVDVQPFGGRIVAADQGLCQAMRVVDVVVAKPPFDTQTSLVRGAIDPLDIFHFIVFDLDGNLAPDTAEGTDAFHFAVVVVQITNLIFVHHARRHQGTGRASLHTLATGHTGGRPHWVVKIESWIGIMPTTGHADHVVDLHLATCPHAETALNTRIQVHAHRHMTVVQKWDGFLLQRWETAVGDILRLRHVPQVR